MSTPTLPDAHARGIRPRRARYRVSDLDYVCARDKINLMRAGYRVSDQNYARDRALARALADVCGRGLREAGVVPSAAGLLTAAAWLLPAADRARYGEEYRSELWELARSGSGRPQQLGYALRQLRRALPAGVALRSLRRRSAAR